MPIENQLHEITLTRPDCIDRRDRTRSTIQKRYQENRGPEKQGPKTQGPKTQGNVLTP
ncbi:hypothetical protein [Allorhizobium sonneratiae]|uniref:hypothetical protein n=1 Tax=Allorhizobium sonneratiae TaxID=2934936 RepID=UPI0020333DB6|nr:hypothetical protein [Allorhizobium sonneratiae]